jgi:hypothetical protein
MVKNEGQRCINSLFQTISSEERMQIVKGLAQMKESNKEATRIQHHVVCKKRNA